MNSNLAREWIQYLRNNQIVAMKSDPATQKLVYRKPVFTDDLLRFLECKCDLEPGVAESLVSKVVHQGYGALVAAPANDAFADGGFIDNPGRPLEESEIRPILVEVEKRIADRRRQEAECEAEEQRQSKTEDIRAAIKDTLTGDQRNLFVSILKTLKAGCEVIHPSKIANTMLALAPPQAPRKGLFSAFAAKPKGPTAADLVEGWRAQGMPVNEMDLTRYLLSIGFAESQFRQAIRNASDAASDLDDPQTVRAMDSLMGIAKIAVNELGEDGFQSVLEYAESDVNDEGD